MDIIGLILNGVPAIIFAVFFMMFFMLTIKVWIDYPTVRRSGILMSLYVFVNLNLIICFLSAAAFSYVLCIGGDIKSINPNVKFVFDALGTISFEVSMLLMIIRMSQMLVSIGSNEYFFRVITTICWILLVLSPITYIGINLINQYQLVSNFIAFFYIIDFVNITLLLAIFIGSVIVWKMKLKCWLWVDQKLFSAFLICELIVQIFFVSTEQQNANLDVYFVLVEQLPQILPMIFIYIINQQIIKELDEQRLIEKSEEKRVPNKNV
jgi:hypothetical protein